MLCGWKQSLTPEQAILGMQWTKVYSPAGMGLFHACFFSHMHNNQ